MKFKIEIRNIKSNSFSVRVTRTTMFDGTFIVIDEKNAEEIDQWVVSSNIGHRIAWDMWQLKNKEAVTLFMMKWS